MFFMERKRNLKHNAMIQNCNQRNLCCKQSVCSLDPRSNDDKETRQVVQVTAGINDDAYMHPKDVNLDGMKRVKAEGRRFRLSENVVMMVDFVEADMTRANTAKSNRDDTYPVILDEDLEGTWADTLVILHAIGVSLLKRIDLGEFITTTFPPMVICGEGR